MQDDLELLKAYEPILCFSGGKSQDGLDLTERFHPIDVKDYLQQCTLWERRKGILRWFLPPRNVTQRWDAQAQQFPDAPLGEARSCALISFDHRHFLRFVDPEEVKRKSREQDRRNKQEMRETAGIPSLTKFGGWVLAEALLLGGAVRLWSTSLKCLILPVGIAGLAVAAYLSRVLLRLWRIVQQSVKESRAVNALLLLTRLNLVVAGLLFLVALWAWQSDLTWLVWVTGFGGAFFFLSVFNIFIEKRKGFFVVFILLGAALWANWRGWDWLTGVFGALGGITLWYLVTMYIEETFTAGAADMLTTLLFMSVGALPWFFLARWLCGGTCATAYIVLMFLGLVLISGEQSPAALLELTSPLRRTSSDMAYGICSELQGRATNGDGARYTYYGRVWRDPASPHVVLQYFYFYAFNDWRYHGGFNLHEGDWEAVFVFLERQGDQWLPYSVGVSQHHAGARLQWASVQKWPDHHSKHPVIYVAAGSHANYFTSSEVALDSLFKPGLGQRLVATFTRFREESLAKAEEGRARVDQEGGFLERLRGLTRERPRRTSKEERVASPGQARLQDSMSRSFQVTAKERPNGQGLIIGSGKPSASAESELVPWRAVLLDDQQAWLEFRGLWGHRTRLTDESGPPGPKWEREEHKAKEDDKPFLTDCERCRLYWAHPPRWLQKAQDADHAKAKGT